MAKEETRNKILKAAEELFSKDGFDGVPTKMIASEAGITEMTLFNHFPNKKLLYKTVVKERFLAIEIESVLSELNYDDLEKDLKKISAKLIENFVCNKAVLMMRLKERESFHDDDSFKIEQDPVLKQIKPVFETYAKKGMIKGTGENMALVFITAFKGLCHLCLLDNKDEDEVGVLIDDYVSTMCHGMICR